MKLLALLAALAALVHAQDNIVVNPGFEELAEDGKRLAAWGLPEAPGVEYAWDEEVAHSGKRSARVTGTDPEKQSRFVQAWRQNVGPLPEGELLLSVWVKAEEVTSGRIGVLHRDEKGEVLLNQGIANFEGSFDWKELAGTLERLPGVVDLQLVIGLQKSTGTVWLDDASVAGIGDSATEFGRLTMAPEAPQVAGETVPATFEVTLGEAGLAEGGSIQLRWEHWRPAREFRLRDFKVEADAAGATFEASTPPPKRSWPPTPKPIACIATLTGGGPLPAGAKVTISADLTYTPHTNVSCDLTGLISPQPNAAARSLAGRFTVRAKGGPAASLMCTAEARPLAGKPGRLTVAVTDQYGNPSADFRGAVRLSCSTEADLPAQYGFTEEDAGSHDFAVRFPPEEVSRVTVTSGEMTGTSNPILPRSEDEPGIYFGDIHSHCEISADAVGDPDQAYDYARRFFGMDFAALSDHSPRGQAWERTIEVGNRHNDPGRFVTILGFEWSDPVRGHRNAYYRDDTGPEQPKGVDGNMDAWWAFFDELGIPVLTVPHHPNTQAAQILASGKPAWGPMDWSAINHKYQRIVEICQARGSFEVPGVREDCGSSVQTALSKGHRLGFVGSTDTHSGRPGNGPARCAIISPELSRAPLWDAMHDRSCYATSGKHILVFFTLNDEPMGSEIEVEGRNTPRQIEWRVIGTGPIERVDLLRNNEVVKSWDGGGRDDLSGTFTAPEAQARTEWWYLRAIQEDTEMAWSSPIWVDSPMAQ
jgi:hypothetical protein